MVPLQKILKDTAAQRAGLAIAPFHWHDLIVAGASNGWGVKRRVAVMRGNLARIAYYIRVSELKNSAIAIPQSNAEFSQFWQKSLNQRLN